MDFQQLLVYLGLHNQDIHVTLVTPVRKPLHEKDGGVYTRGKVIGFKPGLWRSPRGKNTWGGPPIQVKPPRVLVQYNAFTFHKGSHSDWVDVNNCIFELKPDSHGEPSEHDDPKENSL